MRCILAPEGGWSDSRTVTGEENINNFLLHHDLHPGNEQYADEGAEDDEEYDDDGYEDGDPEGEEGEEGEEWQLSAQREQHMRSALMIQKAACLDMIGQDAYNRL